LNSMRNKDPGLTFTIILAIIYSHFYSFNKLFDHVGKQMRLISKNIVKLTGRSAIKNTTGFSQGVVRFICKYDIRKSTENLTEMMLIIQKIYFNLFGNLIGKSLSGDDSLRFQGDGILSLKEEREEKPYLGIRKYIVLKQLIIMYWLLGEGKKHFSVRFILALEMCKIILSEFSDQIDVYLSKMRKEIMNTKALWIFKLGTVEEQIIGNDILMHEFYSQDINLIVRLETAAKSYGKKHNIQMDDTIIFDKETKEVIEQSLSDYGIKDLITECKMNIRNFKKEKAFYFIRREDIENLLNKYPLFNEILLEVKPYNSDRNISVNFTHLFTTLSESIDKKTIKKVLKDISNIKPYGFNEKDMILKNIIYAFNKNDFLKKEFKTEVIDIFNKTGYPGMDVIRYTYDVFNNKGKFSYQKAMDLVNGDFYSKIEAAKFISMPKLMDNNRNIMIKALFENIKNENNITIVREQILSIYEYLTETRITKDKVILELIIKETQKVIQRYSAFLNEDFEICFYSFLILLEAKKEQNQKLVLTNHHKKIILKIKNKFFLKEQGLTPFILAREFEELETLLSSEIIKINYKKAA